MGWLSDRLNQLQNHPPPSRKLEFIVKLLFENWKKSPGHCHFFIKLYFTNQYESSKKKRSLLSIFWIRNSLIVANSTSNKPQDLLFVRFFTKRKPSQSHRNSAANVSPQSWWKPWRIATAYVNSLKFVITTVTWSPKTVEFIQLNMKVCKYRFDWYPIFL